MQKETLIEYLKTRASIKLTAEQDDLPIHGNAIVSGDDDFDKEIEDRIIASLNRGDIWAWARVKVIATFNDFEGVDYLGGCSYKDEHDFKADGYYNDMVDSAISELADNILTCADLLEGIETEISEIEYFKGEAAQRSERGLV